MQVTPLCTSKVPEEVCSDGRVIRRGAVFGEDCCDGRVSRRHTSVCLGMETTH